MLMIKYFILIMLLICSSYIGILLSKKYQNRVKELQEIKTLLNIFNAKIKLTYEPIPQIFEELGKKENSNISRLFLTASKKMKEISAGEAWNESLKMQNTNLKKEDLEILKKLGNLLGKVDLEGQVSEIELVDLFLDEQIKKAQEELRKNEKMYKTLGITIGLAMVIILI